MITGDQLPRRALTWLIACQFAVIVPHLVRVPLWVVAVYLGASLWRLQMHRQRAEMPSRWLRLALGITASIAVLASYRTLIGLEPMIALLLVASALKLLEAIRDRDGYVIVCLGFFISVTHFVFSQSLPMTLYALACTLLLVTAMIALNQRPGATFTRHEPLLALKMLGLAVPMMVVLFFLFPRIGPLWSVPSKSGAGITGMSDFLKPGAVSKLGRSAEVAFRAGFDGPIPAMPALYWRGLVLSQFEDEAWRTLGWRELPASERTLVRPETTGDPLRYRIVMDPTQQRWLYGLAYAESETAGVLEAWDFRLGVLNPLESQFGYDVRSWTGATLQPQLSAWRRDVETSFPENINPRSAAWVTALRSRHPDDKSLVAALLDHFREQPFFYTLEPPAITEPDFVDRFVFDTRRGFCEHYAYSFVALARMAGIPARIVAGYQGGEINPLNNTVVVRQFDAHAWAEVWYAGDGWVRVDPTAAVSPDRIELGLEAALAGEAGFLADSPISVYRLRGISAINWLRLRYDVLAFRWQSFVVGFDSTRQIDLLQDWFGEIKVSWFVAVMLGSWAIVLIPLTFWLNRQRVAPLFLPEEKRFVAVTKRLQTLGLSRAFGESPLALLERVRAQLPGDHPLRGDLEAAVGDLYNRRKAD